MLRSYLGHRLASLSSRNKLIVMIGIDALFLPLCLMAAVTLRLGSFVGALNMAPGIQVVLGLTTLPFLGAAGLYRTVVRHIDLRVLVASGVSLAAVILTIYGIAHSLDLSVVPRSSLLIFWFTAFAYVVTSRFIARSLLRQGARRGTGRPRIRTAVLGAGDAGVQLVHGMQLSPEYEAVCFVDDRQDLHRKSVAGLRVYGTAELENVIESRDIDLIVVAIPSASAAQKRALIARVEQCGVPVKMLPALTDLVSGKVTVSDIREVDVADLLGRDPVPPEPALFARNIRGRSVLVTGAGGSIGGELCRQICSQQPRSIVLYDHSEYALYAIDRELRALAPGLHIEAVLGSVLDEQLLVQTLRRHGVETVYHAAAYKHVPLVEANIQQGVRNNVFGTAAVARAALQCKVQTCVLVSTDKAVRPTNVMGASKRVAELVFQAAAMRDGRTVFSMVRFGNVLGSSGSVVPLFKQQIQAGGPITITHPDIIRYFMLIPEAAQLVIQAGAMARGGEVFVLDMGDPVRIADLARSMIRLSGLQERTAEQPDGDIEIQFVGLRPGEKLFEELLIGDDVVTSGHARILCARERHIDPALLDKMLESLYTACESGDSEAVIRQLRNLVPEYRQATEVNAAAAAAASQRR